LIADRCCKGKKEKRRGKREERIHKVHHLLALLLGDPSGEPKRHRNQKTYAKYQRAINMKGRKRGRRKRKKKDPMMIALIISMITWL